MAEGAEMNGTWWLPLLKPDQQFETGLPPRMLEHVKALRQAHEELGPQRGLIARAATISGGAETNVHHSLKSAAKRLERMNALRGWNVEPVPGLDVREITERLDADGKLEGRTIRQGAPLGDIDPGAPLPGFAYKRVSTLANGAGETVLEWKIQSPEQADLWRDAEERIQRLVDRVPPVAPSATPAVVGSPRLLSQITIADGHVGALGWKPETGAPNWDLNVARATMLAGAMFLIDTLPLAEELLISVLGDYQDTDGFLPLTPASKHLLDVDGRFPKIADVSEQILEAVVTHALRRFSRVRIVFSPGNHDPLSIFWLRKLFTRIFQNEPRVVVEQSLRNTVAIEFGKTLIVLSHGDKIKMSRLPHVIACDFPEQWGRTTHRYGHTGHLHHEHEVRTVGKERDGMLVYQHPTISSRNVWAAEQGLSAARQLVGHCYRFDGGLAGKLYFHPDMMEAQAA